MLKEGTDIKKPIYLIVILTLMSGCFIVGFLYAAPVDVPTEIQGLEGNIFNDKKLGIGLSIAAEADFLSSRKLDLADYWGGGTAKVKGQFYTSKIILTIINKFDIYGIFGKAQNLGYESEEDYSVKPKDKLTWGVGLSVPIYEWKNYGIKFFADGKYRAVNNIDYNSNFQSSSPSPYEGGYYYYGGGSSAVPKFLVDWQEWQVALGAAKRFKYFMPYLGVKYSDFRESSIDSTNYANTTVGIFVGCAVTPIKALSIDLQGRFIDEIAFVVKATYKI
ncbi:MAG: hypothetical protein NTW18_04910 [Candidatus Omnitrophica bacterium]|nr:hypothetical protein [Candidatus Omnitrophota bacterium]